MLEDAERTVRDGLSLFPRDALLYVAKGALLEMRATSWSRTGKVRLKADTTCYRRGNIAFRIFATTVKFGSTTFAISYSVACPMNVCAPRSVNP